MRRTKARCHEITVVHEGERIGDAQERSESEPHDAGGFSDKDVALARFIDGLAP